MPLLPGEAEATWQFSGGGADEVMMTSLGFSSVDDPTGAPGAAASAWTDNLLVFQGSSLTYIGCEFRIGQDSGFDTVEFFSVGLPGGSAGDVIAPNTAYLIDKNTGISGRVNRGRMFIPGVPEAQQNAGVLAPSVVTALQTAIGAFYDDLTAGVGQPAVLHKAVHQDAKLIPEVDRPAAPATDLLSSTSLGLLVEAKLATQRRRLRK